MALILFLLEHLLLPRPVLGLGGYQGEAAGLGFNLGKEQVF